MSKGFVYRFFIYGAVVCYVLLDLKVVKGPLHGWIMTKQGLSYEEYLEKGVVALVFGQPIVEAQVEYKVQEYLYLRGRSRESVGEQEHKMLYAHCLQELIEIQLLRIKTHHNASGLPEIPADDLSTLVSNDELQFGDVYERQDALRRQGYLEGELSLRAAGHWEQVRYLERQIDSEVSADELASYEGESVTIPALRRVRHIFRSITDKDPEQVRAELEQEVATLQSGQGSYHELSEQINDDERAKLNEGELGWVSQQRLPVGLGEALFQLPINEPTILRSGIGWHYLEVLEEVAERTSPVSVESLRLHLENEKRERGVEVYLSHLRARESKNVVVLWNGEEGLK